MYLNVKLYNTFYYYYGEMFFFFPHIEWIDCLNKQKNKQKENKWRISNFKKTVQLSLFKILF